jgi:hypothetical protein
MSEHNIYPIDYKHYLMSRLCDNVDKIFYSGFKKISDEIEKLEISFTPGRSRNPIFFNKPLEAFLAYYIDSYREVKTDEKAKKKFEKLFKIVKKKISELCKI